MSIKGGSVGGSKGGRVVGPKPTTDRNGHARASEISSGGVEMSEKITFSTSVSVTPELMAKMFWGMNSDRQMEFFSHLYRQIQPAYE